MEARNTQTIHRPTNFVPNAAGHSTDELTEKRLDWLLNANAATVREKFLFRTEREKTEAALIRNPISVEEAFGYFGLLLGTFPPLAMFLRFISDKGIFRDEDLWIAGVFAIINLISATVGYFTGKFVGKTIGKLEHFSWTYMLLALPFIGMLWGILAGGAGGIIVFGIGAIPGAILGAMVGTVALPVFTIFHRWLKKGDQIDRRHFLPLAFGITFTVCAFIFGL